MGRSAGPELGAVLQLSEEVRSFWQRTKGLECL